VAIDGARLGAITGYQSEAVSIDQRAGVLVATQTFTPIELHIARAGCCDARRRWLITDPLNYPDYQSLDLIKTNSVPSEADAEFLTRAKQSGGVRLEILPDIVTSTYLQAAANRFSDRDLGLENSLSAQLFGLQLTQENPYDIWSVDMPAWICSQLESGRTVVIADIRDYFESVSDLQMEMALKKFISGDNIINFVLLLISHLNSLPGPNNTARSGIPIAPDEFFWLLSDLVLGPIDIAVKDCPSVLAHMRWVDDYFLATNSGMEDQTIGQFASALAQHGFRINETKTRVYSSVEQFERATFTREHRIVTDLFRISSAGTISTLQQIRFAELVDRPPGKSAEESRLWKRLYALARTLDSPLLIDRALADLDRLPSAELQILSYLGAFGWRDSAMDRLGKLLWTAEPATLSLGALRALLASTVEVPRELTSVLVQLVRSPQMGLHPFCRVLAYACLLRMPFSDARTEATEALLSVLGSLNSVTTRRVGIELLWLHPRLRPVLRQMIAKDRSAEVRSLAYLIEYGHYAGRETSPGINRVPRAVPNLMNWGDLETRLSKAFRLPF
jgi:hypothetical protein